MQESFIFARKIGEGCQMFNDGGLKLLLEEGKKFLSDARAHLCHIGVGDVLAPGLLARFEIRAELRAAQIQKWPHDVSGNRMNCSEARESSAAQNVQEHSFRLVVRGVRNGDATHVAL